MNRGSTRYPGTGRRATAWWLVATAAWLVLSAQAAAAALVGASLDRNPVRLGESVRLEITFDGEADLGAFDAGALEADFNVLGTSTSSEINVVDNARRVTTRLLVDLLPRREGTAVVPPLSFPGGVTESIELKVLPAGAGGAGEDVFLEAEAEPRIAYLQTPVHLSVRLYFRKTILEGNLSDPELDDALVRRFGEDTQYRARRGGLTYQVIERRFVVFPQADGTLTIPRLEFVGRIADDGRGGAFGGLLRSGRRTSAHSRAIDIEVRPPPPGAATPWFPARRVTLTESWPDDPPVFVVGESVTRTLRVEALGVTGEQIPEVAMAEVNGIRHYPDKPVIETTPAQETLLGRREQRVALVPSRPGTLVLPAVEVQWWDTGSDRARVARLPERRIVIEPAPGTGQPALRAPAPAGDAVTSAPPPSSPAAVPAPAAPEDVPGLWPWLAAAFAGLWMLTCLLWWNDRRRRAPRVARDRQPGETQAVPSLKQACRGGEPAAVRAALMAWAAERWPNDPPPGPAALAARLGEPSLAEPFRRLDAACYAPRGGAFDGESFYREVSPALASRARRRTSRGRASPLPPLYPGDAVGRGSGRG